MSRPPHPDPAMLSHPRARYLLALSSTLLCVAPACRGCQEDPDDPPPSRDEGVVDEPDQAPTMADDGPGPADAGADDGADDGGELVLEPLDPLPEDSVHSVYKGCYTVEVIDPARGVAGVLARAEGEEGFGVAASSQEASRFFLKPSDLATYLFYGDGEHHLVVEEADGGLLRRAELSSDLLELDDDFLPGAQWRLEISPEHPGRYVMYHPRTEGYLTSAGTTALVEDAALITLTEAEGCATFPELTLDAEGSVEPRQFEDGSVWGFVETHSHIMSNFGFGGAGIFHGAPFHPLGVEHALPSCEPFHGKDGRSDLFGYGFDQSNELDEEALLIGLVTGRTPEFNHHTEGYPTFTEWPSAHDSSTHQTQYYRWIQRAYLGGLRLMVQHATSNEIICELLEGSGAQPTRYSCNDMVAVDRILEETRRMERYIDAQHGGPGQGWFRIVETPAQAREVIDEGKMAVVLGIETSNLFDCFSVPHGDFERCDEQDVLDALDRYQARGVRAIFPVHKYNNGFSAGDGDRYLIELGNFAQTGHNSSFVQDCPDVPSVFDKGPVGFGGLNDPREDYFAPPPYDMSGFGESPVMALSPHLDALQQGPLEGDWCQNHGVTDLGEFLIQELMKRGMIIEIDHLPRRGYVRAFEMLRDSDYPAAGTHGNNNDGALYELGGISKFNFGRCNDPDDPSARIRGLQDRIGLIEAAGGYPAEGFGFDLNGFAGAPGPRFGEDSVCAQEQADPVTYPFTSYSGEVTFTEPRVGERVIDFNTEGMAHIGLVPELIEDVRRSGVTDEQLEPLFRSAEGYLRMWEKAERRGQALSQP